MDPGSATISGGGGGGLIWMQVACPLQADSEASKHERNAKDASSRARHHHRLLPTCVEAGTRSQPVLPPASSESADHDGRRTPACLTAHLSNLLE